MSSRLHRAGTPCDSLQRWHASSRLQSPRPDASAPCAPIQAYTGLRALYLEGNAISRIEGLDRLGSLRCLHLGRNLVAAIEGLSNLGCLETLDLRDNCISRCVRASKHTRPCALHAPACW